MPKNSPFDKFKKGLIKIGFNETNYYENLSSWMESHENTEQSKRDFFWHIYNTLLMDVGKDFAYDPKRMHQIQRDIYCEMFSFLVAEEKDRTVAQRGINHCDIQISALTGLLHEGIIIGGNQCDLSKTMNGRTFPLKDLLINDIIPYDDCPRIVGSPGTELEFAL